jgi:glycolate oxidase iron-sulfur subunit
MQTSILAEILNTPEGQEADSILRRCVHCGFCTATCPTYQLLGDERDSPRGRIYLVKQLLEGEEVTRQSQIHLDRCLTCRSCETTCPSGVEYHRLADIGREMLEKQLRRPLRERVLRYLLRKVIPYRTRFGLLLTIGRLARPLLPIKLKRKVPPRQKASKWPINKHNRSMILLNACAQKDCTPNTNAATSRVLDKLGIEVIDATKAGCCGAVSHHLAQAEEGKRFMRKNIDAWWPYVEQGTEAIIITASGCGAMIKEYGTVLKNDPLYDEKAEKISAICKDISEVLAEENIPTHSTKRSFNKVAFHSPCTLQHGQQINGVVESILTKAGFTLTPVMNAHLCCGSAGTYSILQPELSQQLLHNKVQSLEKGKPDIIVTANIGCHLHLMSATHKPVKHWIELLADSLE